MSYWMTYGKMVRAALVIGLLGAGAFACGGDDDGDDSSGAGTGGSTAGTGGSTAGTGGTAGSTAGTGGSTAGTGGGGAGGAGGAPAPIMCGTATCMGLMLPGAPAMSPPCCDMDSGGGCGVVVDAMTMACEGIMQPGTDDPSCDTEMSSAATMLMGCCKPDGKCGVRSGALMGCVERTDYPPNFLASMMQLEEQLCGGDADAGMD